MTIKQLAKELAKREGLKKQVDIAQIQELLGHLSDILFEEFERDGDILGETSDCLYDNGAKRAKKRKKA